MRKSVVAIAAAFTLGAIGHPSAETFPSRPVTLIIPFAAGRPSMTLRSVMEPRMTASLGQPLIIETISGASGSIGTAKLARATPDGYTIGLGQWDNLVLNGAMYALSYDLQNDFEPIALFASNPQLIASKSALPASDLKGLLAWLKANPERASQGTAGAGSAAHISGAYFQSIPGTRFQFVPYRGAAPAMQDLLAGQIDLMFDQVANALPHVRAGKIKAYAVTAKARIAAAPEIPTVDEAGVPEFYISIWRGLFAPKGTPKDIVAKLNAAVADALADPNVRQRLAELGQDVPSREEQSPDALGALHKAEIAKWWPIIKQANIKPE